MTSTVTYTDQLRTEAKHLRSGVQISTDAPLDNNGLGESFSPTDLLATSLASCMFTIMGIAAQKHSIAFHLAKANVTKIMGEKPRRVVEIRVEIALKSTYSEHDREILERAALTCPVAKSLHPEIKQTVSFNYS